MAVIKKLPESELKAPGCLCRTKSGKEYVKTSNETRTKHTLWKVVTSTVMSALDEKIPYNS